MKVLRLVVASEITYTLKAISDAVGVVFDDRRVVDIPLRTDAQLGAGLFLERKFKEDNFSSVLRNGVNAVSVYDAAVVDI